MHGRENGGAARGYVVAGHINTKGGETSFLEICFWNTHLFSLWHSLKLSSFNHSSGLGIYHARKRIEQDITPDMKLTLASLAGLAATATAQNLTAALLAEPSVSNLTSFVAGLPSLLATLSSLKDVTILAPNNDAVSALLAGPMASVLTGNDTALVTAILQYHVIKSTVPASAIKETPAFAPTLLNSTTYSNVTGGQVVEAVKDGENVRIFSGLGMNATVTKAVSYYQHLLPLSLRNQSLYPHPGHQIRRRSNPRNR